MNSRTLLVYATSAALFAGCVDTTPLPFAVPIEDSGGGAISDALGDAIAIDAPKTPAACVECVTSEQGACRALYEDCLGAKGCPELVSCVFDHGCFTLPLLQDRIACGEPCFDELGIISPADPALAFSIPINACTQNVCRDVCIGN